MLTTVEDGQGTCHGRFTMLSPHGAMLTSTLNALANPALPHPIARETSAGRRVATVEVRGQAFCQLLERYPIDRLPVTGGVTAQIAVTIPLATLEGRLTTAQVLGTDVELSRSAARRLARAAGVIPAVLGSQSQLLDLGRRSRLHTRSQRLARAIHRQGLCAVEVATPPPPTSPTYPTVASASTAARELPRRVSRCRDPVTPQTALGANCVS